MKINEVVPAKGFTESLVHTEHSVKVSCYLQPTVGVLKGRSWQREPQVQRKKCRGMKQEGVLERREFDEERKARHGQAWVLQHMCTGPGAGTLEGDEGHCQL